MGSGPVTVGTDIGTRADHTAITVTEAQETSYLIRYIRQIELGLKYREIAQRIARVTRNALTNADGEVRLVLDATGVGAPVVELVEEELQDTDVRIIGATFVNGLKKPDWSQGRDITVGKAYLVRRFQVLLEQHRLKLDSRLQKAGSLGPVVIHELQNYEIKITETSNEVFGAFKVGVHDDVATALLLSVLDDDIVQDLPVATSKPWLPGWEQGIKSSAEEEAISDDQKRIARQRDQQWRETETHRREQERQAQRRVANFLRQTHMR